MALNKNNLKISEFVNYISNINEIQHILNKNICVIDSAILIKLLNILSSLSTEVNNNVPLSNIINALCEIFNDGVLEVTEIPLLIKVLHDNISIQNITNINSYDFSLLIKLLIIILMELEILKINSNDIVIITSLIDISLELLNIQIYLPNKTLIKKYCCFLCFQKK